MPTATYIPRSLLNDNGGIFSLRRPAEGLPTGWTRILVRRKNGNYIGKDDPYYFSPMQSYKFRSLFQVKRFLVCLEEAGGDEVAAYVNFRGAEAKIKASVECYSRKGAQNIQHGSFACHAFNRIR